MLQDLRGVFFIIKGQYRRNLPPRVFNTASEDYNWIGGYDPSSPSTTEWYQLLDNITFTCQRASSDLDSVVKGVYDLITKYKTKEHYLEVLKGLSYTTHSSTQVALDTEIYHEYGDFFSALVSEQEDKAYKDLRDQDPVRKARMKFKKRVSVTCEVRDETPVATLQKEVSLPSPSTEGKRKNRGLKVKKRQVLNT